MTDKELLELAAKAAGIKIDKSPFNGGGANNTGFDLMGNAVLDWHNDQRWNPLTDDGDALRLAVKLRMEILVEEIRISVYSELTVEKCEMYPADHLATTRRLIVETAAEIGKAMP